MNSVRIEVEGLPPKKDGANSMWNKEVEIPRIKALRAAVAESLGEPAPPAASVRLAAVVFATREAGDLDNFATGICDALQPASRAAIRDERAWRDIGEHCHPSRPIAFGNDKMVDKIAIERVLQSGAPHYELTIEWN